MDSDGKFDLGGGVTLAPCTEEDYAFVYANLRPGDRAEVEAAGAKVGMDRYECILAIRHRGSLVGFIGTVCDRTFEYHTSRRMLGELTTVYADAIPLAYCRYAGGVLAALFESTAPWVDTLVVATMKSYARAIGFLERIVGARPLREVKINGVDHILFAIDKKSARPLTNH